MKKVIFSILAVTMLASCNNSTETTPCDSCATDSVVVDSTERDTTFSSEELKDTLK
jgi:hypothetical protein